MRLYFTCFKTYRVFGRFLAFCAEFGSFGKKLYCKIPGAQHNQRCPEEFANLHQTSDDEQQHVLAIDNACH